nr:glycosyltransferase family 4 protein [Candidatus Sigynarchaeota archaeon]
MSEIDFLKKFAKGGVLGGIEVAYRNLMKGLRKRGHVVLENRPFPPSKPPHLIICPTFGPLSLLGIWWNKRKYNCACVHHANTTPEDMKGGFLPDSLIPLANFYLKTVYNFSEILITPTTFSKDSLKKLELRNTPPIVRLSNGVDLKKFYFDETKRSTFRNYLSKTFGIDTGKPLILCVGVLWKRKGVDVFHAMARYLPEYEFIWVGDYLTTKKLKEAYDNLPNLTFTGFVDDIVAAYCGTDVFFFPSYSENEGLPLLEAAACKLPILCRDIPTYDWMEDGIDCLKEGDFSGFKHSLKKLVDDDVLRKKLADNAFKNVQDHDTEIIIDNVERVYKRAIALHEKTK